jgi:hypothetical protein
MSSGYGKCQRVIRQALWESGRPLTFKEICDHILRAWGLDPAEKMIRASPQRSMRRAIQRMVGGNGLFALGSGTRGDPHRYFFDLVSIDLGTHGHPDEIEQWKKCQEAVKDDIDYKVAVRADIARLSAHWHEQD